MNPIERFIHSKASHYPIIKVPLVSFYQRVCSIVPSKDFQLCDFIHREGHFYGFHDKCPWSSDNTKLLSHHFDITMPIQKIERQPITVGYFEDTDLLSYRAISSTSAWNWQQGSMLQWIGNSGNIIFNDIVNGNACAKIVDTKGRLLSVLQCHIADVSPDGRYAVSYSYRRLGSGMNGYGYNQLLKSNDFDDNKLFLVNLLNGSMLEIGNIEEMNCQHNEKQIVKFFYYAQFSPNSERISYYYREKHPFKDLQTSLHTINIDGGGAFNFSGEEYSHKIWKSNTHILTYFKPVDNEIGFYLLKDLDTYIEKIGGKNLTSDGHPQFTDNEKHIVLDTYPDRFRNQYLKIYDLENDLQTVLLKKKIPFQYSYSRRCDFHPRFDRIMKRICFDTAHSNTRSICVMNL